MKSLLLFLAVLGFFKPDYVEAAQNQQLNDNQIINIIMTIDKNEIAASKEALKKDVSPSVKNYANLLIDQHEQNLADLNQLAKQLDLRPKDSEVANFLKDHGKQDLKKLEKLQGMEFERSYLNTMIQGHQDGLQLIDTKLLPQTKAPQLQAFVEQFRNKVSNHLERAFQVESTL